MLALLFLITNFVLTFLFASAYVFWLSCAAFYNCSVRSSVWSGSCSFSSYLPFKYLRIAGSIISLFKVPSSLKYLSKGGTISDQLSCDCARLLTSLIVLTDEPSGSFFASISFCATAKSLLPNDDSLAWPFLAASFLMALSTYALSSIF